MDYVTGWYIKAIKYIQPGGKTKVAFVSTNSIAQGEQVGVLWGKLLPLGAKIRFAHRTFKWSNEGKGVAAVHCVIVGFSNADSDSKVIFDYGSDVKGEPIARVAKRINGYLVDAEDVLLRKVGTPICPASPMNYGSMPIDDGHLILSPDDREAVKAEVRDIESVARRYMGGDELLNNTLRYCLWLKDADPQVIRGSPFISNRVRLCKEFRLASDRATTQELAKFPTLFGEIRQPVGDFLVVPKVSSENRDYMPIGFVHDHVIVSGSALIVPNATLFDFGVLTSCMHMAWMRAVCGRLESRYQYSAGIVYNNFPWPASPHAEQKKDIEKAAKAVLAAREAFPKSTLADLYDPLSMPLSLQKAHQQVDRAVDVAYGYTGGKDDANRTAFLFKLYQQYTSLPFGKPKLRLKKR